MNVAHPQAPALPAAPADLTGEQQAIWLAGVQYGAGYQPENDTDGFLAALFFDAGRRFQAEHPALAVPS